MRKISRYSICIFLILLIPLAISVNPINNKSSILHGTLVLTVGTKDGLLICSDKRISNEKGKHFDKYTKIHALGKKALYFSTNAFATGDPTTLGTSLHPGYEFDINKTVKEFFIFRNPENIEAYWDLIKATLNSEVGKCREKFKSDLAVTKEPSLLFQTVFLYLDKDNKIKGGNYICGYNKTNNFDFSYSLEGYVIEPQELSLGFIKPYGELEIYEKLVLSDNKTISDLSKLKKIIKLASNNSNGISPDCDCAILSYKDGFEWLAHNVRYIEPDIAYKSKIPTKCGKTR